SFVYEVLWTRLLGQVLGGSTAAFASMLSSFLLGIALGSAVASRFAKSRESAARGFAVAQLGAGLFGWMAFRATDLLPNLAHAVGASPSAPAPGAAAAGLLLLPVTLCIGATFPFGVRLLARDADEAAAVSGRVYAWNTVGSIIGSILAGFFLLPALGLERTALVGVLTSLTLALATALAFTPRKLVLAGLAGLALVAALVVRLPVPENLLLHSAISGTRMAGELYYLGVGRSATVTVVEHAEGWKLLTNGLPESGVERPEMPDLRFNETAWLSLLPTAARPETEEMLIIGLGGAKTLEAVASSVKAIDVIELEEEVVVANRKIPRANDPLDDPRVTLRLGDARGAMNLTDKRYDAIVSQPSHPWTSGASHLYTREFFELVETKLEPGGIFVQWIGMGFVDPPLLGSLLASMTEVFDSVQVYRPIPMAIVFVASDQPIDLLESAPRALEKAPESFGKYGIHRVEDFYASWTLDTAGARAVAQGHPPNTDDHNRLATTRLPPANAGRDRRLFSEMLSPHEPLTPERLARVDAVSVLRRMIWTGDAPRARELASSLPPAASLSAQGWINYDGGQPGRARQLFDRALALDPGLESARDGVVAASPGRELDTTGWDEAERTVYAANLRLAESDWAGVRALDDALATIRPGALLHGSAARARILWRLEAGEGAEAREALAIVDELLTRERTSDHYYLRAVAAHRMGDDGMAWAALEQVATRRPIRSGLVPRAIALPEPRPRTAGLDHARAPAPARPPASLDAIDRTG
ncbi:MAG TPA: fused MFS/spermidine synthase, partial [Myxococcota bacterium]|nr:fused MFS/spermidine synthase [Myxococcota bacterium]